MVLSNTVKQVVKKKKNGLMPWLQKLGFGKLPGDFSFRLFGRDWFIPLSTTIVLSLLATWVSKIL